MASLKVIRPGMLTTVQDLGRWGHQSSGVPVAGPMDPYSHRLANRLVANEDEAAAIEITLVGPELEAVGDVLCAVAGADFELSVNGTLVSSGRPFALKHGSSLRFGRRMAGARATLCVRGGFAVPAVLGSCATSLISGMGPFGGRALIAGDILPVGLLPPRTDRIRDFYPLTLPQGGARLRVLPGPQDRVFGAETIRLFLSSRFTVTTQSNRMGYRLEGSPLAHACDVLSDATPLGAIQVPRSGQPILLMADRQTTGGYPKIATLISADVPIAGQLSPGDWIRFASCTRSEALDALQRQERRMAGRV